MKKFVLLCSMTGLVSLCSYAQNNVGVNTTTPKSTLDVEKATTFAIGDQAGITFPRLTGNEIKSMSLTGLKTGTVVYATDSATGIVAGTAHAAKITTSGFYFYDGGKWEPFTFGSNKGEWVYNTDSSRIELSRTFTDTNLVKVFYDMNGSGRKEIGISNIPFLKTQLLSNNLSFIDTFMLPNSKNALNYSSINSLKISKYNYNNYAGTPLSAKRYNQQDLIIDSNDTIKEYLNNSYTITVPHNNTNNFSNVYGNNVSTVLDGSGTISYGIGSLSNMYIRKNTSISGYATGSMHQLAYSSSGNSNVLSALYARTYIYNDINKPSGNVEYSYVTQSHHLFPYRDHTLIKRAAAFEGVVQLKSENTGDGIAGYGIKSQLINTGATRYPILTGFENIIVDSSYTTGVTESVFLQRNLFDKRGINRINNLYGTHIHHRLNPGANNIKNAYGLYIENVNIGDSLNYSIYTKAGKVSFGDVTEIRKSTNDEYVLQILNNGSGAKGMLMRGGSTSGISNSSLLRIQTWDSSLTVLEAKVAPDGARVGIGTDDPKHTFHAQQVNGSYLFGANNVYLRLKSLASAKNNDGIQNALRLVDSADVMMGQIGFATTGQELGIINYNNGATAALTLGTNGISRINISQDGRVGIGTAGTTDSAKLNVIGSVKIGNSGDTATPGTIRYNETTNKFQGYVGGATPGWVDLH